MLTKTDTHLTKILVDKGLISAEALQSVLDEVSRSKEGLVALLVKKNLVPEADLLKNISESLKIPFVEQYDLTPQPGVIDKVPLKIAEYYKIVPLKIDKKKLTVAVSSPLDLHTQDDIRVHLGYEVDMVLARHKDVTEALKKAYGFAASTIGEMVEKQDALPADKMAQAPVYDKIESIDNIEKMAADASIAKLVNQIILEAYQKRATDIHIEPYRGKVKLRYRIDGVLYDANLPGEIARFIMPILSRIKIMSSLNIVEKRMPQDGRAIVKVEDTQLDLRVSSIPTPYGESVVIRMLPMNRVFDLEKLGLNAVQQETFDKLINKPHGVIFITGPTGSGKSTTLYACLNKINTEDRKIITIEDPVEYEMEGVTQIQVQSNIGLDFARGLRSMLRHDPDVMMVGEVRDLETAEMAIRVALTGHLVFSTLHTNDAASGITRLVDIGIQPYLVASSIEAFVAQRLIRVICKHCKEEDKEFPLELKEKIAKDINKSVKDFKIFKGKGCNQCNFSGFWGRLAIYELLVLNESIKSMIMRRAPSGEVKKAAIAQGMQSLRKDGWQKVIAGLTTPSEVFEATPPDIEEGGSSEDQPFLEAVDPAEIPVRSKDQPAIDRRLFSRLATNAHVFYRVIKDALFPGEIASDTPEFTAMTKDISAGGLSFFLKEAISVTSILELRITIPGEKKPIQCLAKVVRTVSIEGTPFFETAVCFLDLTSRDRQTLDKFVERESK